MQDNELRVKAFEFAVQTAFAANKQVDENFDALIKREEKIYSFLNPKKEDVFREPYSKKDTPF